MGELQVHIPAVMGELQVPVLGDCVQSRSNG